VLKRDGLSHQASSCRAQRPAICKVPKSWAKSAGAMSRAFGVPVWCIIARAHTRGTLSITREAAIIATVHGCGDAV